jgi:hypothetical protein
VTVKGEHWLIVNQPYLEGMLPYEYSVLLKAFEQLAIPQVNVYLEASPVAEASLSGKVHRVKYYFNKRFYKMTEESTLTSEEDIESLLVATPDDLESTKTLIGFEGAMLPTNTELKFAKKGSFDLYTITNLSFMDLALSMKIKPNLFAVAKEDLAVRDEAVQEFDNLSLFTTGEVSLTKTDST